MAAAPSAFPFFFFIFFLSFSPVCNKGLFGTLRYISSVAFIFSPRLWLVISPNSKKKKNFVFYLAIQNDKANCAKRPELDRKCSMNLEALFYSESGAIGKLLLVAAVPISIIILYIPKLTEDGRPAGGGAADGEASPWHKVPFCGNSIRKRPLLVFFFFFFYWIITIKALSMYHQGLP